MQPLEIEFLPVGEGSRAGDAIAVRYETSPGYFGLIVIDGGTIASGEAMVQYLQALCHGNTPIVSDLVVSHPDQDHSSGARAILENVDVRRVWTHVPWWHAAEALPHFKSKRWTEDGLEKRLKQEYDVIADIVALATDKGVAIREPFAGDAIGPFTVLSPPRWAYPVLLANFPDTPTPAPASAGLGALGLFSAGLSAVAKVVQTLTESWMIEWLRDGGDRRCLPIPIEHHIDLDSLRMKTQKGASNEIVPGLSPEYAHRSDRRSRQRRAGGEL